MFVSYKLIKYYNFPSFLEYLISCTFSVSLVLKEGNAFSKLTSICFCKGSIFSNIAFFSLTFINKEGNDDDVSPLLYWLSYTIIAQDNPQTTLVS